VSGRCGLSKSRELFFQEERDLDISDDEDHFGALNDTSGLSFLGKYYQAPDREVPTFRATYRTSPRGAGGGGGLMYPLSLFSTT
jgi:hypothetical protein